MESRVESSTCDSSFHFCIQMANKVLLKEAEKGSFNNIVLSPLSFHVMLSLIAVGSTGHTRDQLLLYLGCKGIDDLNKMCSQIVHLTTPMDDDDGKNLAAVGPLVSFANGVWVDRSFGLKSSFQVILREIYKAQAKGVDFANKADQVIEEVNSWAENATKGLIKQLLPSGSLDSDTALVLANALYFKGAWDRKFDITKTTSKDFHLLNGHTVQVPFMTTKRSEKQFFGCDDSCKILKIPYQNGRDERQFSMHFFLPDKNNGLPNLIEKFNSNPGFFNQQFKLWKEETKDFWIPRFKFSFEFEASTTMKELGLELPFLGLGEFTELVDSPQSEKLNISNIFHKSYIEVNEDGTEAAASTAVKFRRTCYMEPTSFVADHPFMFMLREETSRIVFFIGAVLNPSSSS